MSEENKRLVRRAYEDVRSQGNPDAVDEIKGSLSGQSPTGKKVTVTGFGSWVVRDGKIAEHWGVIDLMGLLRQIGALQ